jgi:IS5 family transposase
MRESLISEAMQGDVNAQTSFFDLAVAARAGQNQVLETIQALVDFGEAERAVGATYSALGRPGHRVAMMLRIMILQHLYGLSDPQAEEQLRDRLSFQKFVGLQADEAVPDETSICRFRLRLIECELHVSLLEMLNRQLAAAGYLVKRTTLVDATLIESSRQRPSRESAASGQAPDPDARYTRKHGQSYYGYKAHVSADGRHQLICRALVSAASVHDGKLLAELVDPHTRAVYGDKAYESKENKAWLSTHRIANGILKKGAHHIKLTPEDKARNQRKSRRRCAIERVFAHLKKWHHYQRARYLGLVKNQLELTLKAVAYNLKRWVALATA